MYFLYNLLITQLINFALKIFLILCLDPASIVLYRYNDPNLGPRIRPVAGNILKGKTEIPRDSVFNVNIETENIEVSVGDQIYPVGESLIYIDKSLE